MNHRMWERMPSAEQAKAAEGAEGGTGDSKAQAAGTGPLKGSCTLQGKSHNSFSVQWKSILKNLEGESVTAF